MSLGQDLADFLLARIAEDEAVARAVGQTEPWHQQGLRYQSEFNSAVGEGDDPPFAWTAADEVAEHVARHQPARALADCAAKRKIVEELRLVSTHADTEYDSGRVCAFTASLLLLADVYADHPDYDQTWRP